MENVNNFQSKSAGIYLSLGVVKWGAWKFLAITSAVLFGGLGYQYAQDNLPGHENIVAIISVAMGYLTIDYGLGYLLSYYYDHTNNTETDPTGYRMKMLKFVMVFIIIRFLCTITISFWSAGEVADRVTTKKGTEYFINALERQDSTLSNKISNAKDNYTTLSKSESKRIRDAKKKGHETVLQAVRMGDTWQRRSWNQNRFSWLESSANRDKKDKRYAASIRQAIADSTAMVTAEYERTKTAEQTYNATLSDNTTAAVKDSIGHWASTDNLVYQERRERRTTLLIFADFFFGLIGWLCEYVQALMRKAGVTVRRKRTLAYVTRNILASWAETILIFLEKTLMIDLDGNGEVGTVGPTSTPPTMNKNSFLSWLKKDKPTTVPTTGATAKATGASEATTAATTEENDYSATPTTAATTRPVIRGFQQDATPTTKPATPVPTGVSAGAGRPATTATAPTTEIVVQLVHGIGYVIHNGEKRDESWVKKQLRAYKTRQKDYRKKGSDTTVVDANIELFERYLLEIEKLTAV